MSETAPLPPPGPPASTGAVDHRQMALIVYILHLAGLAVPLTPIVGVALAYVNRDGAPDWLQTHYRFQIRTFWISLLYFVVAALLCVVLIGFLLLPAVAIWFIVRCAIGISFLMKNEPYPRPDTWIV
jgi:uncharacterized membrane protein